MWEPVPCSERTGHRRGGEKNYERKPIFAFLFRPGLGLGKAYGSRPLVGRRKEWL